MDHQTLPKFLTADDTVMKLIWPVLKRGGYAQNEDSLLQAIRDNKTRELVHLATIGLGEYGTERSLPSLKDLARYPSNDVKTTSVVTIGIIAGAKEAEYYASLLDDPAYKDKAYPMIVIWETDSKEALPAVIRYADKVISGKVKLHDSKDYRYIIEYLKKYPSEQAGRIVEELVRTAGK